MAWIYLLIAGLFEIAWAIGMKMSEGFTKPIVSFFTVIGMIASFYFLSLSLKSLPLGTAYPIWTGIGAIGTVILGIVYFNESKDLLRLVFILFIIAGVIGLKFVTK